MKKLPIKIDEDIAKKLKGLYPEYSYSDCIRNLLGEKRTIQLLLELKDIIHKLPMVVPKTTTGSIVGNTTFSSKDTKSSIVVEGSDELDEAEQHFVREYLKHKQVTPQFLSLMAKAKEQFGEEKLKKLIDNISTK